MKPPLASIMKMPLRVWASSLSIDHDAGGDAGAVEQVGGQADDALDVSLADQVAADVGLGIAAKQHAVRQDARAFAGALERADDVQQVGVVALLGGRRAEGLEALVRVVERIDAGAPAFVGERRIGDDVVEGLERVAVLELGIGQRVALHDRARWGCCAGSCSCGRGRWWRRPFPARRA